MLRKTDRSRLMSTMKEMQFGVAEIRQRDEKPNDFKRSRFQKQNVSFSTPLFSAAILMRFWVYYT